MRCDGAGPGVMTRVCDHPGRRWWAPNNRATESTRMRYRRSANVGVLAPPCATLLPTCAPEGSKAGPWSSASSRGKGSTVRYKLVSTAVLTSLLVLTSLGGGLLAAGSVTPLVGSSG